MTVEIQSTVEDRKLWRDDHDLRHVAGPEASGYDEVTGFYRRMFEEINWAPGGRA